MAIQLQIRRGTTTENDLFTGATGELSMDTDTNGIRIHDGTTVGGFDVPTAATADYVVEWQAPTDLNNYTWYRKYKSGWVEQGGRLSGRSVTFPIEFASLPTITTSQTDTATICAVTTTIYDITTTGFSGHRTQIADTWHNWVMDMKGMWVAYGIIAQS